MTIRCFLMVTACLSCLGCHAADPSNPKDTTSSAGDPPAARAQAQSAAGSTVVYAYYFHQTYRCLSSELMETTAAREIEEHFARQLQDGQVVWMPVNIDTPAGKVFRQQFNVQGSALVLARMQNGVYKDSKSLDKLWGLLARSDDFSKCVVDEVNACLSGVQERWSHDACTVLHQGSGECRASAGYCGRYVVHLRVGPFGIEIERKRYE